MSNSIKVFACHGVQYTILILVLLTFSLGSVEPSAPVPCAFLLGGLLCSPLTASSWLHMSGDNVAKTPVLQFPF